MGMYAVVRVCLVNPNPTGPPNTPHLKGLRLSEIEAGPLYISVIRRFRTLDEAKAAAVSMGDMYPGNSYVVLQDHGRYTKPLETGWEE